VHADTISDRCSKLNHGPSREPTHAERALLRSASQSRDRPGHTPPTGHGLPASRTAAGSVRRLQGGLRTNPDGLRPSRPSREDVSRDIEPRDAHAAQAVACRSCQVRCRLCQLPPNPHPAGTRWGAVDSPRHWFIAVSAPQTRGVAEASTTTESTPWSAMPRLRRYLPSLRHGLRPPGARYQVNRSHQDDRSRGDGADIG
jgi:hypothetical protein